MPPSSAGVWETCFTLAVVYAIGMMTGASGFRIPPPGFQPGRQQQVHGRDAYKAAQFWLIWLVLCLNVSACIGILGLAASMLQDIFGATTTDATRFAGLISICTIGGGFAWASLSGRLGPKRTYTAFLILGIALYALLPAAARSGNQAAFVVAICIIASIHGGGFGTVPAYVADIFGSQSGGAIYGRVLTAWPAAVVLAPAFMRYVRDKQRLIGVPWPLAYDITMYILATMLLLALVANALVRPIVADNESLPRF